MRAILGACALCCGIFSMPEADASVLINIDLSSQTMHVSSDMGSYDWRVSTARSGYRTPRGTYRPYQLQRTHFSHKYHMSPMPYSIFFAGGYAIHGTYETASLGRPVSHGCIRLAPGNAAHTSLETVLAGRIWIDGRTLKAQVNSAGRDKACTPSSRATGAASTSRIRRKYVWLPAIG
jgi:hypothetical protein